MQTDINSWSFTLEGDLFSEHFLKDRLPESKEFLESKKEAEKLFDEIKKLYQEKKEVLKKGDESSVEEFLIKPLLKKLGHVWDVQPPVLSEKGIEYKPDYALFSDESLRDEAITQREKDSDRYFELSIGLVEAKKWNRDLDRGKTRSPAVQIKKYLRITQINWGILTNGKKWRLYCKESGFSSNVYLEFDLEEILVNDDLRSFQYFYTILNQKSFFKRKEKSFLDRIYDENIRFARGVEDDLEENVYKALKILSEGFLNFHKNDLEEKDIETIHDNCLILLYRLLFLFYAESKKLIRFENGTKRYSLLIFTRDIIEEKSVSSQDDYNWRRLKRSFDIVNKGSWKVIKERGIPPYNGGLFDPDKHGFLEEYSVGDSYLREAIDLLARRKGGKWVDYETLQIRHLGSIYEKLLEYKLKVAGSDLTVDKDGEYREAKDSEEVVVKEGEVYLVTDKGERKASGSYYTPDYVVQYIVENTIGKLIEEKTKDARDKGVSEAKAILQMKVLDPAMGSGHFLVAATDYMAEELLDAIHRDVENNLWDKNEKDQAWAKREIVSHCIYGVDLNPLAVELAKLSLWLTTFAEGHPLNFLDHRLKCGNSLVGTEIDKLPYFPGEKKKGNLYTPYIEVLTKQVSELLEVEEETVDDVKKKERLFKKIKESKAYKRVKTLADARTATFFDVDIGGKDPKSRYMDLVNEAYYGNESKWNRKSSQSWVRKGRKIAEEKNFFHWELEFSEVFFEKGDFKDNPGFDVIAGNPPWVDIKGLDNSNILFDFFRTSFNRVNIYGAFFEKITELISNGGLFGFITPNSYMTQSSYNKLRKLLLTNFSFIKFVRLPDGVFEDATMETVINIFRRKKSPSDNYSIKVLLFDRDYKIKSIEESNPKIKSINVKYWKSNEDLVFDIFSSEGELEIIKKLDNKKERIEDHFDTCLGITPYDKYQGQTQEQIENRVFHSKEKKSDKYYKVTTGSGIQRYLFYWKGGEWIKYGDWLGARREKRFFTQPRCVVRQIVSTDDKAIKSAYTDKEMFHTQVGFVLLPRDGSKIEARNISGILNSRLMTFYHRKKFLDESKDTFQKILIQDAKKFPVPKGLKNHRLNEEITKIEDFVKNRENLNLNILDYLGRLDEGKKLGEIYNPPKGLSNSILTETSKKFSKLRIAKSKIVEHNEKLILYVTARYKNKETEELQTDRWGYYETKFVPAMEFTNLTDEERGLLKEILPICIEKTGGFANFRKKATKTKSLINRLEKLTLPKLEDVKSGLEKYLEQKKKAERLEEEIQETDNLIDAIVFDLYNLNEEEVITVLDSLDTEEKVKEDILEKINFFV